MNSVYILRQFYVCQILLDQNAHPIDLALLTACSKAFKDARKLLLYDTFTLTLCDLESYEFAIINGARRVRLWGEWIDTYRFDFTKRESRLIKFICWRFNQPVASFGSLMHFACDDFNHPINSFDSLMHFECVRFNQAINSFGSLTHFESEHFNQPINSFGSLMHFICYYFNRPINSFGFLKYFNCALFNQTVKSFDFLVHFPMCVL